MESNFHITLAQPNVTIGHFEQTFEKIKSYVDKAVQSGSDLIVFPELFLTGYSPLDRLEQMDFLHKTEHYLEKVKQLSGEIGIIIGAPARNTSGKGKALFNSAFFFYQGELLHRAEKGLIPNYDVFDEYRYFEPADEFSVVDFKGQRIALTVCEDLWDKSDFLEYRVQPLKLLLSQNPSVIINIAASPFDYLKFEARKNILIHKAEETGLPLFYVNNTGAHADLIFDGGSIAVSPRGEICGQMRFFEEDLQTFSLKDIFESYNPLKPHGESPVEKIHKALLLGIRDYFSKTGFTSAVIGLSGGIDSALVAALAVQALGKDNIQAVFLPTAYSSQESFKDASQLADRLEIKLDVLNIEPSFRNILSLLEPAFSGLQEDITEENIQSRLRGLLLMAYSNKFRHILLNTSNKSEMATGYGTLYGDMCGSLSVIGDLYKTQVYELTEYINKQKEIIQLNIITKEPTAELKPGQKDIDSLPPYKILDLILFHYLELGSPINVISSLPDMDENLVKKVITLVDKNEFKRFQAPPVLRISPKAFGTGRRFPLVGK